MSDWMFIWTEKISIFYPFLYIISNNRIDNFIWCNCVLFLKECSYRFLDYRSLFCPYTNFSVNRSFIYFSLHFMPHRMRDMHRVELSSELICEPVDLRKSLSPYRTQVFEFLSCDFCLTRSDTCLLEKLLIRESDDDCIDGMMTMISSIFCIFLIRIFYVRIEEFIPPPVVTEDTRELSLRRLDDLLLASRFTDECLTEFLCFLSDIARIIEVLSREF